VDELTTCSAITRANRETHLAIRTVRFLLTVTVLDVVAAAIALVVAAKTHSTGPVYVIATLGAVCIGLLASLTGTWLFQFFRAPYRQRDEALAEVAILKVPRDFPRVGIDIGFISQSWELMDGTAADEMTRNAGVRVKFTAILTNREPEDRVSLAFVLAIHHREGIVVTRVASDQHSELPFVLDARDTKRLDLSFFIPKSLAERAMETETIGSREFRAIPHKAFQLAVTDQLSQQRMEMFLPGGFETKSPHHALG
jgi:hypothetical protein